MAFIDGWQEDLEKVLMKRKDNEGVEDEICLKKSKVFKIKKSSSLLNIRLVRGWTQRKKDETLNMSFHQ